MSTADPRGEFSHAKREALVDEFFAGRAVDPATAWKDVYRLLLWADPTTGLAHCYESDKAQPGRHWYPRSLVFHQWLARQLGVDSLDLQEHLDWMFQRVMTRVEANERAERANLAGKAALQRDKLADEMPAPGTDPRLRQIVDPLLPATGPDRPDEDRIREVLTEVRTHIAAENKRKNLLGRGFEDVLGGVIRRLPDAPPQVATQTLIQDIPGFREPRSEDKGEKVDLWIRTRSERRLLVSAKWSVRADREKQMAGDFQTYVACNALRQPFEYYWVTNEFDPARLVANATNTVGNDRLFRAVVHICPEALEVVHELGSSKLRPRLAELRDLIAARRIIGLSDWLKGLSG